jgi:dipeptidase D
MQQALQGLEPKSIWKHFDRIAAIPRASTKEAVIRQYVLDEAARLGLKATQDAAGNVVVSKASHPGRESATPALLQGHLDMVCEKNEGTSFNFDNDGIRIMRDGDWLKADGTTLGSDNGIGVAAALAVMENTAINHGPLEFVFTIDEETGLTGASEFPGGVLKSKYFLNLDGEEKGILCIGCAGGILTKALRRLSIQVPVASAAWRIKVSGLRGGHSGVDIHLGRGNAIRILGATLQAVIDELPAELADMKGGSAQNAIPREAFAVIALDQNREGQLRQVVARCEEDQKVDLGAFDPELTITLEKAELPQKVLAEGDARRVVDLLASLHHGVLAMSPDVPGLVQNSTNLATLSLIDGLVEIVTSQRSAIESSKQTAASLVATSCRLAGFETEHSGSYPGWKPEPGSEIVRKLQEVNKKLYGEPAKLVIMHAGLECGVIGEKYPGMQMISFGPHIVDVHSPSERLKISSVAPFWAFLTGLLERL